MSGSDKEEPDMESGPIDQRFRGVSRPSMHLASHSPEVLPPFSQTTESAGANPPEAMHVDLQVHSRPRRSSLTNTRIDSPWGDVQGGERSRRRRGTTSSLLPLQQSDDDHDGGDEVDLPSLLRSMRKSSVHNVHGSTRRHASLVDTNVSEPSQNWMLADVYAQDGRRRSGANDRGSRQRSAVDALKNVWGMGTSAGPQIPLRGGSDVRMPKNNSDDVRSPAVVSVRTGMAKAPVLQSNSMETHDDVTSNFSSTAATTSSHNEDIRNINEEGRPHRTMSQMSLLDSFAMRSDELKTRASGMRHYFERVVASHVVWLLSCTCSAWMLLGRDIYMALVESPKYDRLAFAFSAVCLVFLVFEVVARSLVYPFTYGLSFWSLLDIVACLSLLPDVITLADGQDQDAFYLHPFLIARVSFAAATGSRLIKVLQGSSAVLRMQSKSLDEREQQQSDPAAAQREHRITSNLSDTSSIQRQLSVDLLRNRQGMSLAMDGKGTDKGGRAGESVRQGESQVGAKLNRGIASVQIGVVAVILVVAHLLEMWTKDDAERMSLDAITRQMGMLERELARGSNNASREATILAMVAGARAAGYPMTYIQVNGVNIWGNYSSSRRSFPMEVMDLDLQIGDSDQAAVRFDLRDAAVLGYWHSVILVVCVSIILAGSTGVMSYLVHRDVAVPMQRMVGLVNSFAEDPLQPLPPAEDSKLHPLHETVILQNALVKFGSLLQLGFGEAGAAMLSKIIHETKQVSTNRRDTSNQAFARILDVGRVVSGFFGFCNIGYFTDLTEILQADVVRVVNNVARHIHQSVKDNHGAPNKNMGDTFLLVWMARYGVGVRNVADASLRSLIRSTVEVSRNREIAKMTGRAEVQARMPGFNIRLGFGLHFGWAVECAIGSDLKIDASYLSPHVNLASRLQSATKQYGVDILISREAHCLLSPSVQSLCRLVDRVTFKGTAHPMELYTYDIPPSTVNGIYVIDDDVVSSSSTKNQSFFSALQPVIGEHFRMQFSMAIDYYLGGTDGSQADWLKAEVLLSQCLLKDPLDGPALAIKAYIKRKARPNGECPSSWNGIRALETK